MDPTTVIAFAAAVQAVATVVLVVVTWRYVIMTGRLARSAEEQFKLNTMPNLFFEGAEGDWRIINLGPYSAHIHTVHAEKLSRDEVVVGRGRLKTDGRILFGWNKVIGPNQEITIRQVLGTGGAGELTGLVRLVFYFVYGPTGPRTHALDVKLRIDSFHAATVHSQRIRLDEVPPELPATSIDQIQSVAQR